MSTTESADTPRKPRGTRKAAAATNIAKLRKEIEQHERSKREREARERARTEALRRSLKLAETNARKVDRDEWRQREEHLAAVVGRLALTELVAVGTEDLRLDPKLLHRLVDADVQKLKEWLAHMLASAATDLDSVDIALPGGEPTPPSINAA